MSAIIASRSAAVDLAPLARPRAPGARARCCEPHRAGAHAVDQEPGGGGLEAEAEPLRVGDQDAAACSRAFGASNSWISPAAALTAFASFAGALARAIRTTVRSGGSSPSAAATGVELAVAPALDPVGEQVAARLGQRHRRDRRQQRLVVGRAAALARLEYLERAGARPRASARARRRARVASIFAPSVPAIRYSGAHLLGHRGRV